MYNASSLQGVCAFTLFIYVTKPQDVDLKEYTEASLRPWYLLIFEQIVQPIVAWLEETKTGPVCAFYPESDWCNLSLALLKGKLTTQ